MAGEPFIAGVFGEEPLSDAEFAGRENIFQTLEPFGGGTNGAPVAAMASQGRVAGQISYTRHKTSRDGIVAVADWLADGLGVGGEKLFGISRFFIRHLDENPARSHSITVQAQSGKLM